MSHIPPPPARAPRISGSEPAETQRSRSESARALARRVPRPALIGGAVVVALGGSYLAASLALDDTIAPGTSVHGVDIGGLAPDEAERTLLDGLADDLTEPVRVVVGDVSDDAADPHLLDPAEAGLTLDAAATVAQADRPGLFGRILGTEGDELSPVVAQDEDLGRAELELVAAETGTEQTEGGIAFEEGEVRVTEPAHGATLDVDAAVPRLADGFLGEEDAPPLALPVTEADPLVDTDEVSRALTEFAEPAMSDAVLVTADGEQVTLTPETISRHLTMEADDQGTLQPRLDGDGLVTDDAVTAAIDEIAQEATDARLDLRGGEVVVTADAQPGREVVTDNLGPLVLPLLTETGPDRTVDLPTREVAPTLTRDTVDEHGVVEEMSSFTVDFEAEPYRITNIGRAAELIDGSVVEPGEIWSFNETVGRRTEDNGFVEGVIILEDQYQTAQGGGVSAVATTMFNAVFFAGVRPVEYGAHSFYIERYPEGREATVAWGSLDNSFENDSGNTIYIKADSDDTSVTITFLGTKKYDAVESETGERTQVVEPETREGADGDCVPQQPLEGFDVTVERVFLNDGEEVGREEFHTTYTPRDEVVCDGDDAADDD